MRRIPDYESVPCLDLNSEAGRIIIHFECHSQILSCLKAEDSRSRCSIHIPYSVQEKLHLKHSAVDAFNFWEDLKVVCCARPLANCQNVERINGNILCFLDVQPP